MLNYYYSDSLDSFQSKSFDEILGVIAKTNLFDTTYFQSKSWQNQIQILKEQLKDLRGTIFIEFSIPRMGKRVDVVLIIENIVFVIEFKVGEQKFLRHYVEQVWDYALDLKNFHKPSHEATIVPILVSTEANKSKIQFIHSSHNDGLVYPILVGQSALRTAIIASLEHFQNKLPLTHYEFSAGTYSPTPSIIEAAISLYNNHSVEQITRSDAAAKNLRDTTNAISKLIDEAKEKSLKIICFVTGVPGSGKTLAGLKVATEHLDKTGGKTSVYLSGNAPLVSILQEALARDKVSRELSNKVKITKKEARQAVKAFIQIIHHYRDAYLADSNAPFDHVAIFDEAQRAWNKEQTVKFMKLKKNRPDFDHSEPEFLISCLDRHRDWAVVVCLVGGGQEINTGEAGISEWLKAIHLKFQDWIVCLSPNLSNREYSAEQAISLVSMTNIVRTDPNLHLTVCLRSFRAENLSLFINYLLDRDIANAKDALSKIKEKYPIVLTRDINTAKNWLREKARGSERYGMLVSSQAQRLKPFAIDVKSPIDPVNWFLENKDDVRSSYYLEDVATEFHVQGLEIDWACVAWDGDLRFSENDWQTFSFKGNKWQNINGDFRKKYLVNAYRVLLTRARQGLVILIPDGDSVDHTRKPEYYDSTYQYLKRVGLEVI